MEKRMTAVNASAKDGDVYLFQPDPCGNDDACIVLHPDQVPVVVQWLREAALAARLEGE